MFQFSYSLSEISEITSPAKCIGETNCKINTINSLSEAKSGELSFLGNAKYKYQVPMSHASVIIVPENYIGEPQKNQVFLFCKDPSVALGELSKDIENRLFIKQKSEIHPSAVIDPSAKIGKNASIGANVFIGENTEIGKNVIIYPNCVIGNYVKIGDDTEIKPNVTIMDFCELGNRVILQPGAVIGSDGFGYATGNGVHAKLSQIGNVMIEDDVEIGANTTIDRARFKSTIVGKGTKIDNLVQIAHNVIIGKGCLLVSQVGIAGSTTIGNYVVIGGQSGIVGHVNIGDKCMFGAQTGVNSDCEAGSFSRGSPAMPYMQANKYYVLRKKLPELFKRVDQIEQQINNNK